METYAAVSVLSGKPQFSMYEYIQRDIKKYIKAFEEMHEENSAVMLYIIIVF